LISRNEGKSTITLKQLWKNEYFQTILMILVVVALVFGFWYGSQAVLRTNYPALAVASTSMLPTLNVGDLIIVQGATAAEINASFTTGDVIVFRSLQNPDKLIVHRAIKVELIDGDYSITTHGDNNPTGAVENFPERNLVGKVVGKFPFLGNFALFTYALGSGYFFIIIAIIVLIVILALPLGGEKKKVGEVSVKKTRKLFGKLELRTLYFLLTNIILILLILFSLWGSLTFWQIGSDPAQEVTIRGMFSDLQYYLDSQFGHSLTYNNITSVFLSQGLLTYRIDAVADDQLRTGVWAFSWAQFFIIVLAVVDLWTLVKYLRMRRSREPVQASLSEDWKAQEKQT